MIELSCGCYFPIKKGSKRWKYCKVAERLYIEYTKTGKPQERQKYDLHFQK